MGTGSGARRPCSSPRRARRVAVADLDPVRAASVADEVGGVAVVGDVTDPAGARKVVDDADARLGGLDRVANIVGLATFVEDIFAIDTEVWEHDLRINLVHHLDVSRAAARHMIDDGTGGAFALVASVSGIDGAPDTPRTAPPRRASCRWPGPWRASGARNGIRVNCVAPDVIMTPRLLAGQVECHRKDTPPGDEVVLGRWGKPEDIAGPLVFLLSDLSSFMTGRTLVVDGGSMVHFPHGGARRPASVSLNDPRTRRPPSAPAARHDAAGVRWASVHARV